MTLNTTRKDVLWDYFSFVFCRRQSGYRLTGGRVYDVVHVDIFHFFKSLICIICNRQVNPVTMATASQGYILFTFNNKAYPLCFFFTHPLYGSLEDDLKLQNVPC